MNSILHQQLEYASASELVVKIDPGFGWVSMTCEGEDLCFLRGERAIEFIEGVDTLWEDEEFNGTYEEAGLICGYPYLDRAH